MNSVYRWQNSCVTPLSDFSLEIYVNLFICSSVHKHRSLIPLSHITFKNKQINKTAAHQHMYLPVPEFLLSLKRWRGWKFGHKSTKEHNAKGSMWQQIDLSSDSVCCSMWLLGAVWRGLTCTNTQPQLIQQNVPGFITFSQQKDFTGAINDLLFRYSTPNK